MRIKLKKGKQKKLINLLKRDYTWKELSKNFKISEGYLRNELRKEKTTLSKNTYDKICSLCKIDFDRFIVKKLDDNWGRSKGGRLSIKKTKKIKVPRNDENLSEIIGIILGDGHLCEYKRSNNIRVYSIKIAGNSKTDKEYLIGYIPLLFKRVFNEEGSIYFSKKRNLGYFNIYGKNYIEFMKSKGLKPGNKKKNNQGIPKWIIENKNYLRKCIRGLIDTDGSIHYISKNNLNLRIDYTSHIHKLLRDVRESFIVLGFNPSKIIKDRHFFLSSQKDVNKYLKEIGFGNKKNLNRLKILKRCAPVVQRPNSILE